MVILLLLGLRGKTSYEAPRDCCRSGNASEKQRDEDADREGDGGQEDRGDGGIGDNNATGGGRVVKGEPRVGVVVDACRLGFQLHITITRAPDTLVMSI